MLNDVLLTSWLTFFLKHPCVPNCGAILNKVKLTIDQITGAPLAFGLSNMSLLTKMYNG